MAQRIKASAIKCARIIDDSSYEATILSVDSSGLTIRYDDDGKIEEAVQIEELRWTSQTGYELIQKTIAGLQSGGAAAAIAQADFIVNHENEPEIEPYLHSAQSPIIPHQPLFPFFEETSMSRNDSITVRVSCETQFKQVSDTSTCAIRQRRLENDRFLTPRNRGLLECKDDLAIDFRKTVLKKRSKPQYCTDQDIDEDLRSFQTSPSWMPLAAKCDYCERWTSLRCKQCNRSFYCSRRCQRLSWPLHKEMCDTRPFEPFLIPAKVSTHGAHTASAPSTSFPGHGAASKSLQSPAEADAFASPSTPPHGPREVEMTVMSTKATRVAKENLTSDRIGNRPYTATGNYGYESTAMNGYDDDADSVGAVQDVDEHTDGDSDYDGNGGNEADDKEYDGCEDDSTMHLDKTHHTRASTEGFRIDAREIFDKDSENASSFAFGFNPGPQGGATASRPPVGLYQADACLPCASVVGGVACTSIPFAVNSDALAQLTEMGLPDEDCRAALLSFNNNVDEASNWIFENPGKPPPPPRVASSSSRRKRSDGFSGGDVSVAQVVAGGGKRKTTTQRGIPGEYVDDRWPGPSRTDTPVPASDWISKWEDPVDQDEEPPSLIAIESSSCSVGFFEDIGSNPSRLPLEIYRGEESIHGRKFLVVISQTDVYDYNTELLLRPLEAPPDCHLQHTAGYLDPTAMREWSRARGLKSFYHKIRLDSSTVLALLRVRLKEYDTIETEKSGASLSEREVDELRRRRGRGLLQVVQPRLVVTRGSLSITYEICAADGRCLGASEHKEFFPTAEGALPVSAPGLGASSGVGRDYDGSLAGRRPHGLTPLRTQDDSDLPMRAQTFTPIAEDVNAEKIAQLVDIFQVPEQRARQALTACFGDVDNAAAWIADNNISDSDADFSHKGSVHSSLWGVD